MVDAGQAVGGELLGGILLTLPCEFGINRVWHPYYSPAAWQPRKLQASPAASDANEFLGELPASGVNAHGLRFCLDGHFPNAERERAWVFVSVPLFE